MSDDNEKFDEVQEAHFLRAMELVANSWESDEDLTIEDMTVHLEQMIEVVNNRIDFPTFLENANLTKYNRLN